MYGAQNTGLARLDWFLIWRLSSDNLESPGGGKWERCKKCQKKKKSLPHPTITTKEYRETERGRKGGQEGSLK